MANSSDNQRKWLLLPVGILALIATIWLVWLRLPPPQLSSDEQVFKTVDALFTAVTARDEQQLQNCERRLKDYHKQGRISDEAAESLNAAIQQARAAQWEDAARRLYDFILGQQG